MNRRGPARAGSALVARRRHACAAADPVDRQGHRGRRRRRLPLAGRAAGLVPGTKVSFAARDLVVAEVTETTASVGSTTARLAVGDTGTADVTPGASDGGPQTLAKPRPAEAFVGQWPEPVAPADAQQPRRSRSAAARRPAAPTSR